MSDAVNNTNCIWNKANLGDLINIKGGFSYKGKFIGTGSSFLLGMGCVSFKGKFLMAGARSYSGECSEKYLANPGDIVLATRQQSDNLPILGAPAIIPAAFKNKKVIVGTNLYMVSIISDIDNTFLFWLLKGAHYRNHILSCSKGTTVKMITKDAVESFEFELPQLREQKAIASVLSSLDDKIDLLHRQNKTLEAMAETLFRQWFVEEADESWEKTTLFEAIELIGGGTPKTSVKEYWNGKVKWLSGGDIASNHKSIITNSEKSITLEGLNNSSAKLLPKFSMVISARGTVGKYCILSEPMAFSQSNYGIKPKYDNCFFFTYLLVSQTVEELNSAAYGSVFDTITTSTFKGVETFLPPSNEVKLFENDIRPYFLKILNNQTQIRTLEKLRDTLLSKLMSGEVRVEIEDSE